MNQMDHVPWRAANQVGHATGDGRERDSTVSVLELALATAALLIGLTGAWPPCGLSMVETIGLAGDGGRRRTTIAACATFAPGAVLGGMTTFGLLSGLGQVVHG